MAKSKSNTNLGKMPPQDIEVEKAVLGAIINRSNSILRIVKDFNSNVFYKEAHQLIAEIIIQLHTQSKKIDLLTVNDQINKLGYAERTGGAYYLTELTGMVVSDYHLESHYSILREHHINREQIQLYTEKMSECYELKDPYEIANSVSSSLSALMEDSSGDNTYTMAELAIQSTRQRESRGTEIVKFTGLTSGIAELDKVLLGFKEPDFTVIAGRPAMGKTAVALNLISSFASQVPTAFFSLEMSAQQIYGRILSNEAKVGSRRIKQNDLTSTQREHLSFADQNLSSRNIIIDDTPALNIDKFRSKLMILKHKYNIGVAVIDYLQLMKGNTKGFGNSNAEITEISGKLKKVAKELKIPIVALAQLSRAVESRKDENFIPKLSDLRESGSIEQDADNVIFLWRPEYYELKNPVGLKGYSGEFATEKLLVLVVAKCREGETKKIPTQIDLSTMTVTDHPSLVDQNPQHELLF